MKCIVLKSFVALNVVSLSLLGYSANEFKVTVRFHLLSKKRQRKFTSFDDAVNFFDHIVSYYICVL